MSRFVLAATLGASYGIYGPAYELCVNTPIAPGKEEYLNSEKYEIKHWDTGRADSLQDPAEQGSTRSGTTTPPFSPTTASASTRPATSTDRLQQSHRRP